MCDCVLEVSACALAQPAKDASADPSAVLGLLLISFNPFLLNSFSVDVHIQIYQKAM